METRNTAEPTLAPKRPFLNTQHAVALAEKLFHFKQRDGVAVKEFDSYDDRNFHLTGKLGQNHQNSQEFVLKVLNYVDSTDEDLIDAYVEFMLYAKKEGFSCPTPVKVATSGKYYTMCKVPRKAAGKVEESVAHEEQVGDRKHIERNVSDEIEIYSGQEYDEETECICAVWLFNFVPGKCLYEVPCSAQLLNKCGQYLAELHLRLKNFSHSERLERPSFAWNLDNTLTVKRYIHVLKEQNHIKLIEEALAAFSADIVPRLSSLDKQVIHGDWNEHNVLVSQDASGDHFISGFIDVGDVQNSYRVFDVGIAMAYNIMLGNTVDITCIEAGGHFLAGYQSLFPLSDTEFEMLHSIISARFCESLVYGAYQYHVLDPNNHYLLFTAKKGWAAFEEYLKIPRDTILRTWRSICHSSCQ